MFLKPSLVAITAAALLGGSVARAAADDVAAIVHKSNPVNSLTMAQLRKVMLSQEIKWPTGSRIVVWLTPPGQRERAGMLKLVCAMSETDFTLYSMHASVDGAAADLSKTAATGALVRKSVADVANGLGLIWAWQADASVKVLAIDGIRPGEPGYKLTVK